MNTYEIEVYNANSNDDDGIYEEEFIDDDQIVLIYTSPEPEPGAWNASRQRPWGVEYIYVVLSEDAALTEVEDAMRGEWHGTIFWEPQS